MRPRKFLFAQIVCATLLIITPASVWAQILYITPSTVDSSAPVEKALRENKGRASTNIEGRGGTLRLTYQTSAPLTIYMVPLSTTDSYVPTDFLMLTLPSTDEGVADIDLTVSPGWTPRPTKWLLHLLTKDEGTKAGFLTIDFLPTSAPKIVSTFFRHLLTQEPYTPSSYHALRGYRLFSMDATLVAGILLLLTSITAAALAKKDQKLIAIVCVLLIFQAAYGLRFGLDLLRFSSEHLSGYRNGVYDETGSVHLIAPVILSLAEKNRKDEAGTTVFVCRSGTNYKEKLLRYFAYPVRVSSDSAYAKIADYVLVMNSMNWSMQTITAAGIGKQFMRCDDLVFQAEKLSSFPDGSILFTLIP